MRRVCIYIYRAARAGYTSMDCNQEQCQDRELLFHREIPPFTESRWWVTQVGRICELANWMRQSVRTGDKRTSKGAKAKVTWLDSQDWQESHWPGSHLILVRIFGRWPISLVCPLPTAHLSMGLGATLESPATHNHTLITKIQNSFSNNIEHICLFTLSLVLIPLVSSGAAKFLSAQLAKLQQRAQPSLTVVVWAAKQFPPD